MVDARDPSHRPDHQPNAAVDEDEIDQILSDSFPASDAPPWTLGVVEPPPDKSQTRDKHRSNRRGVSL